MGMDRVAAAPSPAFGRDSPTSGEELGPPHPRPAAGTSPQVGKSWGQGPRMRGPCPATSHRLATNLLSGLRDSRVPLTFLGGPEGHVRGGGNRAARPCTGSREAIRRGHLLFCRLRVHAPALG